MSSGSETTDGCGSGGSVASSAEIDLDKPITYMATNIALTCVNDRDNYHAIEWLAEVQTLRTIVYTLGNLSKALQEDEKLLSLVNKHGANWNRVGVSHYQPATVIINVL
jgi:hypothetical protein